MTFMVIPDGECAQVIIHPAISVWSVSTMPNGDIVSGCSDSIIRVFSNSEDRWASEADQKTFEDQVSNQALPSQQVGDVKKTDLPGPEALVAPGSYPIVPYFNVLKRGTREKGWRSKDGSNWGYCGSPPGKSYSVDQPRQA